MCLLYIGLQYGDSQQNGLLRRPLSEAGDTSGGEANEDMPTSTGHCGHDKR